MSQTVLLLGCNIGDRVKYLNLAIEALVNDIGIISKKSSVYESEPWGFDAENSFLNQVVIIESELLPNEVLRKTQKIEKNLGRVKTKEGYESRTMDIDILFYESLVIETETLIIPHPEIHIRKFTLEPLCEILPDKLHPLLNKTIKELLVECSDNLWVKKFSD